MTRKRVQRDPLHIQKIYKQEEEIRLLKKELKDTIALFDQAEGQLSMLHCLNANHDNFRVRVKGRKGKMREGTPVLLCSDWHVEEPVHLEAVNGLNEYSLRIAGQRIERLANGFLWMLEMVKSKFVVKEAVIALMGDLISGYIHDELVEMSQLSPTQAILWLQDRLVSFFDFILENTDLDRILVPCVVGNHGRTTHKKRVSTAAQNSFEWLLYKWLESHYKDNKRIDFFVPNASMVYLDVYDYTLRIIHGDTIGFQGGIGGITIPLNKKIFRWNTHRFAGVTCYGHFHHRVSTKTAEGNASLIGTNAYSQNNGFEHEPASQSFFVMDSENGKCVETPIWVQK